MEHWTDIEREALKSASTLEEMAEIALSVLRRMKSNKHQVVQICGPMSTGGLGNLKLNMERFRLAVRKATDQGLIVFNQLPFQEAIIRITGYREGEEYYVAILEVLYRKIFESGYINRTFFLPGWQDSVGASWERKLLKKLGIPTEEYPIEWLDSSRAGSR